MLWAKGLTKCDHSVVQVVSVAWRVTHSEFWGGGMNPVISLRSPGPSYVWLFYTMSSFAPFHHLGCDQLTQSSCFLNESEYITLTSSLFEILEYFFLLLLL